MYSVFEQFQCSWWTSLLSWLLNWLDFTLYFLIADKDCAMRAHFLWCTLTSWQAGLCVDVAYAVLMHCCDYFGACCIFSHPILSYMFEQMSALLLLNSLDTYLPFAQICSGCSMVDSFTFSDTMAIYTPMEEGNKVSGNSGNASLEVDSANSYPPGDTSWSALLFLLCIAILSYLVNRKRSC